jgi:hypothetical protein
VFIIPQNGVVLYFLITGSIISVKWLTDSQGLTGPDQTDKNIFFFFEKKKNINIKCSTYKNIGISVMVNIGLVEAGNW